MQHTWSLRVAHVCRMLDAWSAHTLLYWLAWSCARVLMDVHTNVNKDDSFLLNERALLQCDTSKNASWRPSVASLPGPTLIEEQDGMGSVQPVHARRTSGVANPILQRHILPRNVIIVTLRSKMWLFTITVPILTIIVNIHNFFRIIEIGLPDYVM